jgi:ABC-type nitrate/sulfonate/bicarbonate transport system permease component
MDASRSPSWDRLGPLRALALPLVLLTAWEAVGRAGLVDVRFVPPPSRIVAAFPALIETDELWGSIAATLVRMGVGFLFAAALGISLGLLVGTSPRLRRLLGPLIELLRPIPGVSLIPVAVLWFGLGNPAKISVVMWATFFPVLLNTILGCQETPPILVRAARVMEINGARFFWKVMLPAALPSIFTGLRLSVGYALISATATEMIEGPNGLGFLIVEAQRTFRTPEMFAGIITVALLGFLATAALQLVEHRLLAYRR